MLASYHQLFRRGPRAEIVVPRPTADRAEQIPTDIRLLICCAPRLASVRPDWKEANRISVTVKNSCVCRLLLAVTEARSASAADPRANPFLERYLHWPGRPTRRTGAHCLERFHCHHLLRRLRRLFAGVAVAPFQARILEQQRENKPGKIAPHPHPAPGAAAHKTTITHLVTPQPSPRKIYQIARRRRRSGGGRCRWVTLFEQAGLGPGKLWRRLGRTSPAVTARRT